MKGWYGDTTATALQNVNRRQIVIIIYCLPQLLQNTFCRSDLRHETFQTSSVDYPDMYLLLKSTSCIRTYSLSTAPYVEASLYTCSLGPIWKVFPGWSFMLVLFRKSFLDGHSCWSYFDRFSFMVFHVGPISKVVPGFSFMWVLFRKSFLDGHS